MLLQPVKKVAQAIADIGTSPPAARHICSDEFEEAYNHESQVYHGRFRPVLRMQQVHVFVTAAV